MSKSFDEIMKVIEEKAEIDDEKAKAIIKEHGALSDDEKKQVASALKMKKALSGGGDTNGDNESEDDGDAGDEVSMDDYLEALSVLDSEDASEEEKKKAKAVKDKFEA